ncbi:MAG: cation transporter [Firmicutes bacterium]|nr:cation transporter [Bacillota bacterium]
MEEDKHSHEFNSSINIRLAFLLNLAFTILEIIGGFWTNSTAILSDALHDLGDSLSLGLSWFLENYSQKEPDQKFTFGYSRFSLLGALLNSFILIGGSIFVLSEATPRLFNPQVIKPREMLLFSIGGIIINGIAAYKLKHGESLNEKVVSWHLLEDVLGWIAIFIVSIVVLFYEIHVLDPILSILITIYVLYNVIKNLRSILTVFLQGIPIGLSVKELELKIINNTEIKSIHHTHLWTLEGEKNLLSTHIVVEDEIDKLKIIQIKKNIRKLMKKEGIEHVTIEVEYQMEYCSNKECQKNF